MKKDRHTRGPSVALLELPIMQFECPERCNATLRMPRCCTLGCKMQKENASRPSHKEADGEKAAWRGATAARWTWHGHVPRRTSADWTKRSSSSAAGPIS
mmetsp:Transcript_80193/g.208393  ORF Transcript_80193/g.208393 Transcript_80193/m.208393 type:complete len:100 (+) Transcript_80193:137-436(+)